jgi:hypothetical protein
MVSGFVEEKTSVRGSSTAMKAENRKMGLLLLVLEQRRNLLVSM